MSPPPFEELVAEHGPTVLRVCRAVLGPADAEDAWSETFLAALDGYPRLPSCGTDGTIGQYVGGVEAKRALLTLEGAA